MTHREGETCLCNEVIPASHIGSYLIVLVLQWFTGDRLLTICGNTIVAASNSIRPRPSSVASWLFSSVAPFVIAAVEYSTEGATLENSTDFRINSRRGVQRIRTSSPDIPRARPSGSLRGFSRSISLDRP